MSTLTHLLFDLGGVIVELSGRPIADEWIDGDNTPEDSWNLWLTSEAPKAFESGRIGVAEFGREIVAELKLTISPDEFMERFLHLPVGPFDGALPLLHALKPRYRTGIFSNSNALHWSRKMGEMHLQDAVHDHFASHLIGYVKPDPAGFRHVLESWAVAPENVLFLDDNQLNVDAAHALGMQAARVQGVREASDALENAGVRW